MCLGFIELFDLNIILDSMLSFLFLFYLIVCVFTHSFLGSYLNWIVLFEYYFKFCYFIFY